MSVETMLMSYLIITIGVLSLIVLILREQKK